MVGDGHAWVAFVDHSRNYAKEGEREGCGGPGAGLHGHTCGTRLGVGAPERQELWTGSTRSPRRRLAQR